MDPHPNSSIKYNLIHKDPYLRVIKFSYADHTIIISKSWGYKTNNVFWTPGALIHTFMLTCNDLSDWQLLDISNCVDSTIKLNSILLLTTFVIKLI